MDNRFNDISSCNSVYGGNMKMVLEEGERVLDIELVTQIYEIVHDKNKSDINKLLDIDLIITDLIHDYEVSIGLDNKYLDE